MKHFYFLITLILLCDLNSFGQDSSGNIITLNINTNSRWSEHFVEKRETGTIRVRCGSPNSEWSLCIIDGIVAEESEIKNIDANDIKSITVLKGPEATAFFCSSSEPGVVIIITNAKGMINVKDAINGKPIPGATVDLIFGKHKKKSIRLLLDSIGQVSLMNIQPGVEYELNVSSIGYKNFNATINSETVKAGYSVSLERNYTDLKEVVVIAYPTIRCRSIISCPGTEFRCSQKCVRVIKSRKDSILVQNHVNKVKLYPNPVSRSQQVSIEFDNVRTERISLRLFSLDGKLIATEEYEAVEGMNKINYSINSGLTAGAYAILLINGNGRIIKTDKLIIQ